MKENIKIDIIKDYIKLFKKTNSQFCNNCGIGLKTFNNILKSKYCNRLEILLKMAKEMKLPLWVLIKY